MFDGDPRAQILRLEADIEELTEVIERCRKIILISHPPSKTATARATVALTPRMQLLPKCHHRAPRG